MAASRTLLCLLFAASTASWMPAAAQGFGSSAAKLDLGKAPYGSAWVPGTRAYLGLNPGNSQYSIGCSPTTLFCDYRDRLVSLRAGTMLGSFWGTELSYLGGARLPGIDGGQRGQAMSLSLIGKTQLGPSVGIYGKLGAVYGRTESPAPATNIMGAGPEQGIGFGAGMSVDFTPRLSATLEWDSNDLRFAGGGRDPVRSTSLGLRFRY